MLTALQFDEEDQDFGEEFLSERDPSILHFLLASGDEVRGMSFMSCPLSARLSISIRWLLAWRATLCYCQPPNGTRAVLGLSARVCARQQIDSKQLRDDLMTMLIAGHETTAAVLTWTLHCLNGRPDVLARLQAEVRMAATDSGFVRVLVQ